MEPNEESEVRATFQAINDYLLDSSAPAMNHQGTIFVYHNPDALVAKFESTTGREFENWLWPLLPPEKSWIIDSYDFIAVNTSADSYEESSPGERQHKLAISIFDTYRRGLTGNWERTPKDVVHREGPRWLQEGAAEYFVYHALEPPGSDGCYTFRGPAMSYPPRETALSLGDAETEEGYYSLENRRRLVFLALELLADLAGRGSIPAYYASLNYGIPWHEAFRTAFGMTVEEFYQRFEGRRAAGFAKPGCPTLPPLVTMPGLPDYIKWQIHSEVDRSEVEAAVQGVRLMYEYGESLGIPDRAGQVTVFMDNDLERMVRWYQEKTGWNMETVITKWKQGGIGTVGRDYIVVMPNPQRWSPDELAYPLAHELVHTAYQGGLAGWLTDPASFDWNYAVSTPRWLAEGMAMLLPEFALPDHLTRNHRAHSLRFTENTTLTLAELEIHPPDFAWRIGPAEKLAEAHAIIDCYYQCGFLATELLASYVGLSKLPDYYMHLEQSMVPRGVGEPDLPRPGWRLAFEKAYGMTVDEFYDLFEEHRAAGFPELEIPEVVDR